MRLTRARRMGLETLLVFLAFALPSYLQLSSAARITPGVAALLPGLLLAALPQIGLLLYLLGVQGELSRPLVGVRALRPQDAAVAILLAAAMLGVLAASQVLLGLLPAAWAERVSRGPRFSLLGWTEIPSALVFAVVAATREELLYRSYLYVRLRDLGVSRVPALAVTTALFAAAHAYQGPLAVILAAAQGLLLAMAFLRSRSLWVPVMAHALYNFALLAWTLVPGQVGT